MNSKLFLQPVEKGKLSWAGCLRQIEEREEENKIYTENIGMNELTGWSPFQTYHRK